MIHENLSYTLELENIEAAVISYRPRRPAPPASNHDNQNFSDPGDDEEIEFVLYWQGKKIEDRFPDFISSEIYEYFVDILSDKVRKTYIDSGGYF